MFGMMAFCVSIYSLMMRLLLSIEAGEVGCARIGAVTTEVFLGWKRHW